MWNVLRGGVAWTVDGGSVEPNMGPKASSAPLPSGLEVRCRSRSHRPHCLRRGGGPWSGVRHGCPSHSLGAYVGVSVDGECCTMRVRDDVGGGGALQMEWKPACCTHSKYVHLGPKQLRHLHIKLHRNEEKPEHRDIVDMRSDPRDSRKCHPGLDEIGAVACKAVFSFFAPIAQSHLDKPLGQNSSNIPRSTLHKPQDLVKYCSNQDCQFACNPQQMPCVSLDCTQRTHSCLNLRCGTRDVV